MRLCGFTLCVLVGFASCAPYPTDWSFLENEAYTPPALPSAEPSQTFDDSDPGGYLYKHRYALDLNELNMLEMALDGTMVDDRTQFLPFAPAGTGMFQYLLIVNWDIPPVIGYENWNCTHQGLYFQQSDYTGLVDGKTVCDAGACCGEYIDNVKFDDDQMNWHTYLDNLVSSGLCEDMFESMYCAVVDGHTETNCQEGYSSPGDRNYLKPCLDVHMMYWLACPVYKNVPLYMGFDMEPPLYDEILNLEEGVLVEVAVIRNDRVCHTYSYYNPASTNTGGSDTAASSPSSSTASESAVEDSESSASVAYSLVLAAVAFLLY